MNQKPGDRAAVRAGLIRCGKLDLEFAELAESRRKFGVSGYDDRSAELAEARDAIFAALNGLNYITRQALCWHYLHSKSWEWVGENLHFSPSRVRAIATEGLDQLVPLLKSNSAVWAFCTSAESGKN